MERRRAGRVVTRRCASTLMCRFVDVAAFPERPRSPAAANEQRNLEYLVS